MNDLENQCRTLIRDSSSGETIPFRNAGIATDLRLAQINGTVTREGHHTVVRIPNITEWLWAHRLIYDKAPALGDFERWNADYKKVFSGHPTPRQRSFSWDGISGESGDEQPFLDDGFKSIHHVVLHTREPQLPPRANMDVDVRRVSSDSDWEGVFDCAYDANLKKRDNPAYRTFIRELFSHHRRISEASHSRWFGAFDGEQLVGTLGVFSCGTIARYQGVVVRETHRKQGVAGRLTYEAAVTALTELGAQDLILGTIPDSSAQRLYEGVGFKVLHYERGLIRKGTEKEEESA